MPRHVCQKLAENLTVNQGLMMLGVGKFRVRLMTEAQYDDYLNGTDAVFETVIVDDETSRKRTPYFPVTPNVRCIVVEEIIGGVFLDVEIENDEVWDVEKVRGVWPAPKFEPVKSDALG